ncbi:MAG: hypothetical protein EON88_11175 [Brevundimonas sp.]|nr:MAG: hypothetical protein EON88_11175 [Brevundimonas sp.]
MIRRPFRTLLDIGGVFVIGGGVLAFAIMVAVTVAGFMNPGIPYGAHIPILGLAALVAGLIGGGGMRLVADIDRRLERLEIAREV